MPSWLYRQNVPEHELLRLRGLPGGNQCGARPSTGHLRRSCQRARGAGSQLSAPAAFEGVSARRSLDLHGLPPSDKDIIARYVVRAANPFGSMAILRCYFITRSAGPRACRKEPAACQDALVPRAILDKADSLVDDVWNDPRAGSQSNGIDFATYEEPSGRISMTTPDRAFEFHGHGCPFMPLGYRMGIRALRELEVAREQDHELSLIPELGIGHPQTCLMDDLPDSHGRDLRQVADGTDLLGKLAAVFYHPSKGAVRLSLRPEFLDEFDTVEFFAYRREGFNHPRSQWRSQPRP